MSVLGLDVGTTGAKAVAFRLDGTVAASAYREYPLYAPKPGWQELDPEEVWQGVRAVLSEVAEKTTADPIRAMAISSQGEACHAIDAHANCLTRSPVTFDARTADAPAWWAERADKLELATISGMPVHGMYSINKIRWFKDNAPEVYAKAWKFVCYEDFVHAKLGLPPTMNHSLAARTMALDVKAGTWSKRILDLAGIDEDKLPTTAPSGEIVGTIPDGVAAELGLPRGVLVATGGHDQPAGALGAGILEAGEAVYATGTVDCICPIFDTYAVTDATVNANLCCYNACVPDLYASIAFNFTGGSLLKWYRDTFASAELTEAEASGRDVYDLLCASVPDAPENLLLLPHFTVTGTPHFDTQSRGLLAGLTLTTKREDVVSAILSGVTYEMKLNLEVLRSAGVAIERLRTIGGGAKSPVWVQRKADIMGIPVATLEVSEGAAYGVAMLAAKAAGLIGDIGDFARETIHIAEVRDPEPARAAAYAERYALYTELYPAMKTINHALARLESSAP